MFARHDDSRDCYLLGTVQQWGWRVERLIRDVYRHVNHLVHGSIVIEHRLSVLSQQGIWQVMTKQFSTVIDHRLDDEALHLTHTLSHLSLLVLAHGDCPSSLQPLNHLVVVEDKVINSLTLVVNFTAQEQGCSTDHVSVIIEETTLYEEEVRDQHGGCYRLYRSKVKYLQ